MERNAMQNSGRAIATQPSGTAIAIGIIPHLVFSPQIALLFAYSRKPPISCHNSLHFSGRCLLLPFVPMGMMSSGLFQGTGRGVASFILSLLRNVLFIALFAGLLALTFGMGEYGV